MTKRTEGYTFLEFYFRLGFYNMSFDNDIKSF